MFALHITVVIDEDVATLAAASPAEEVVKDMAYMCETIIIYLKPLTGKLKEINKS